MSAPHADEESGHLDFTLKSKPSGSKSTPHAQDWESELDVEVYTNVNDPHGNKRLAQAKEKRDRKLREIDDAARATIKELLTGMGELNSQIEKVRSASKGEQDATMQEFEAAEAVIQNDVARQQQTTLSLFATETAPKLSAFVAPVGPEDSWLSRLVKALRNKAFFQNLDTWTSTPVTIPDSFYFFVNEKGVFSLCYPDQNPELVESTPIDPSVDFPYASSIFVASKYLPVRGDLGVLISRFCKLSGLPEPFLVRIEDRGSWLIYEITGDDMRDKQNKTLFHKMATTGTIVPILVNGEYNTFNFKLEERHQDFSRPGYMGKHFELVSSKVILADTYRDFENRSPSCSTKSPTRKAEASPLNNEKFEIVNGPIFSLVNGKPYILIPQVSLAHKPPQIGELKKIWNVLTAESDNIDWVKGNDIAIYATFKDHIKAETQDRPLLASRQYLSHVVWGKSEMHYRREARAFNCQDE